MKKAFTFAELMISLIVIAIITAILYPTIADLAPNNNEQLFRNTYKTIELIVADIIGSSATGTIPVATNTLCNEFMKRLNTVKHKGADGTTEKADCDDDVLQTSNGVRWFFKSHDTNSIDIYVDVNASNNESKSLDSTDNGAPKICDDSDITSTSGNSSYCTDLKGAFGSGYSVTSKVISQDTFKINVDSAGKISITDGVATTHLRNSITSSSATSATSASSAP